jgi:aspartate aminotransferase
MTAFHPSRRGLDAPASPIRRLMPHADAAKRRGVHVHHLNIGQPDIATPAQVILAYHGFRDPVLAYGPSEGTLRYRTALAGYYNGIGAAAGGRPVEASDILVTTGGSEALLFAIASVCDPGDEILVAEPFYPNYKGFAHMLGVHVRAVTTRADAGFHLPAERLAAAIGPKTRALIVSSPGNPTGAVLSLADLGAIGHVCKERGVYFVSDEVYREFVYDGHTAAPSVLQVPGLDDCAIVVDSVSKRYSACGARIGCLVTRNHALWQVALKFAQTRLSPPVVDQLAAEAALATPPEVLRGAIADYERRRDVLCAGLQGIAGVSVQKPAGAFYLIAGLPVDDAERFCIFLLDEFQLDGETVMLAPADGFYATAGLGKAEARAAYVLEVPKLERAVRILDRALAAYPGRR